MRFVIEISIHASREGSDERNRDEEAELAISIHASRGGSDLSAYPGCHLTGISIHASRGGSDKWQKSPLSRQLQFQSTLPAGEAT